VKWKVQGSRGFKVAKCDLEDRPREAPDPRGRQLDIDLYLVDPNGERVASGATSANPETFEYIVRQPGAYTLEVTGFATVAASYTLTATVTRAISAP